MTTSPARLQENNALPSLIDMQDVVKIYSTAAGDFTALKGINVQVQAGEFLGVIGKSGAGKSTFLNMITGVDDITTGSVVIRADGEDVSIHDLDEDELALWRGQTLGVVFQSFQLLPMLNLVENITLLCRWTCAACTVRAGVVSVRWNCLEW